MGKKFFLIDMNTKRKIRYKMIKKTLKKQEQQDRIKYKKETKRGKEIGKKSNKR